MFESLGAEFRRIEAVDAKYLKEANPFLSKPAEACFLSHLEAIGQIAGGGSRFGIIVEDDFQITNLSKLKQQLIDIADMDFDVVQIGWLNNTLLDKIVIKYQDWEADFFHLLYLISEHSSYLKTRLGDRLRIMRNGPGYKRKFVSDNFKSGCHFYAISRDFAKTIHDSQINPVMPIDNFFATLSGSRRFNILRTRRSFVGQSNSISSIKI